MKPYLVKKVDGVDVGIVGLSPAAKITILRAPGHHPVPGRNHGRAKVHRRTQGQGIRHIVLLSHLGYDADKVIAPKLSDVDVIIGGDSHSLLGDFKSVGVATSSGPTPPWCRTRTAARSVLARLGIRQGLRPDEREV